MGTIDRCDYTREQVVAKVKAKESLRGLDLRNLVLTNLDLRYVDFTRAYIHGVNFTSSDLRGANFTDAYLYHANLGNSCFGDCIFTNANLTCVNFFGATGDLKSLEDGQLTGAIMPDGSKHV
jgi:uncharacterized protein YjbI with pentapeptide repeats